MRSVGSMMKGVRVQGRGAGEKTRREADLAEAGLQEELVARHPVPVLRTALRGCHHVPLNQMRECPGVTSRPVATEQQAAGAIASFEVLPSPQRSRAVNMITCLQCDSCQS